MTRGFRRSISVALLGLGLGAVLVSQETVQVGYTVVTGSGGQPAPVGAALFSVRNLDDVLISEAGVAASVARSRGRILVDQRGTNTGIALVNPDDEAVDADLVLRNQTGAELDRISRTFQPGEHFARNVGDIFNGVPNSLVGSLSFESDNQNQGLAAITIRQSLNSRNETLFATLPVAELTGAATAGNNLDSMIFPHIGAGAGLSTQIVLIERGGQAASGTIELVGTDGNPLAFESGGDTASEFPFQMAPNGVFVAELTATGSVRQGYATVRSSTGVLPAGSAIFRFRDGDFSISEAGVTAIAPTRRARIFVDNHDTQTGVAVAVPQGVSAQGNGSPVQVRFDLLDLNGGFIESTTRTIAANGQTAIFADQLFPAIPDDFTGLMEISSDDLLVPITLKFSINSRGDFVLTTLPIADLDNPPTDNQVVFPQVGFGGIPGFGSFGTRLILIAPSEVAGASGTLRFMKSESAGSPGTPLNVPLGGVTDSQFDYELEAGGVRQLLPGVDSPLAAIVIPETSLTVNEGETLGLNPILLDEAGNVRQEFTVNYSSLDENVVEVDDKGRLTGINRGFSTVTVVSQGILETVTVTVATITAGTGGLVVSGIAQDQTQVVYLSNASNHTLLRTEDLANQDPTLWAGQPGAAGLVNSTLNQARFNQPRFLAIDLAAGQLYVSDSANHAIRTVETVPGGAVTTLAGDGTAGSQDGALNFARFNRPNGVAIDRAGRIWVADSQNNTIRLIDLAARMVSTIAGQAGTAGNTDGKGSTARFRLPLGIAVETEPLASQLERQATNAPPPPISVIVADTGNNLLRRVFEDGTVETVGAVTATGLAPSGLVPATFSAPTGVAVDSFGNIYFSEPSTSRVRIVLHTGEVVQAAQSGTFQTPLDLAITTRGRAVVAERSRAAQEIRYAGPSINNVAPDRVSNLGGTQLTITGRNLAPDSLIVIGGVVIQDPGFINTGTLSFTIPALPSGEQTLTVQHRGGLAQASLFVDATPISALNDGEITTIAGGSTFSGDGRLAPAAALPMPTDVALDSNGLLYIATPLAHRVRRVDPVSGIISTVAGIGTAGIPAEESPATATEFADPSGVVLDTNDNLYLADRGTDAIYRIDALTSRVTRIAGTGMSEVAAAGTAPEEADLDNPTGLVFDEDGNLYISESGRNRILRLDPQGTTLTRIAGTGLAGSSGDGGNALSARFSEPRGLALIGPNLFVADLNNHTVRRINLNTGIITRFAGTGTAGYQGDGGPANQARLSLPADVAADGEGNLLIADAGNSVVRRVSGGIIDSLPLPVSGSQAPSGFGQLALPVAVAAATGGEVFVAAFLENRIFRLPPGDDFYQVYAGNGEAAVIGDDGEATRSTLNAPEGLALGPEDDVFIADTGHQRIRKVTSLTSAVAFLTGAATTYSTAVITTVAGTGTPGFSGDGGPASEADLNHPTGLSLLPDGDLLISDTFNHRLRKLEAGTNGLLGFLQLGNSTAQGQIQTIAGTGMDAFSGDGGPALNAALNFPGGTDVDAQGRIFVADRANNRIRRIDPGSGTITTVFGATPGALNDPRAVLVDLNGDLIIADTGNNRVIKVDLPSGQTQLLLGVDCLSGSCSPEPSGEDPLRGHQPESLSIQTPTGLAMDAQGNIYVAYDGYIKRVSSDGTVTTIAGDGQTGFSGDNGSALVARFNGIGAMAFDSDGNLYLLDRRNGRVRVIKGVDEP